MLHNNLNQKDTNWPVFVFSTVGAACAYTSYLYFKELKLLNRIQRDIDMGHEPQSVAEAHNIKNKGKYCLVSGILLSYDELQASDSSQLLKNIEKMDHVSPMAEIVLKNQLNFSTLSFNKNFTHIENRYNQAKFHLADSTTGERRTAQGNKLMEVNFTKYMNAYFIRQAR